MSRKRNRRMKPRTANCCYLDNLLGNNRPPPHDEVVALMNTILPTYVRLREGNGSQEDVIRLGVVLNTGCVRGRQIDQAVVGVFELAGEALIRCERRLETHGRYGFDGPGLAAMGEALDLYQDLLALSGIKQMHDAELEARRQMVSAMQAA
jgi:hypothetical protein